MKKRLITMLMAAAMTFALAACGNAAVNSDQGNSDDTQGEEDSGSGEVRIAFLLISEADEYWSSIRDAIEAWDEENAEASVDIYWTEAENGIQAQQEQMDEAIAEGYDAICAAPQSSSNLVDGVIKACEAGIPVVNLENAIDAEAVKEGGGNMVAFYTTDNVAVGQEGAEFIREQIGEGQVAILEGMTGDKVSDDRTQGATMGFESQEGIEIIASQEGQWDRTMAADVATNIIQTNPGLKAFYCDNDAMALGVYEAVVNAGKQDQILVVGTDGTVSAVESVKNGELAATVGRDGAGIATAAADAALEAAKDGWTADAEAEMPTEYLDFFLVTPENAGDYL